MNPADRIAHKERILHRMRVAAQQCMAPEYVVNHLDLDIMEDHIAHVLMYRLTSHVLAEDLGTKEYEVGFTSPRSWWQHFKRDVLGMKCKLKLETRTVVGHGYRGYPHAPIALPVDKMGSAVVFETFELGQ